jgi:hypothetical protein
MGAEAIICIPFLIALGVVAAMGVLQALLLFVGGIGLDFDGDADLDLDVEVDAIDVDLDADVDIDADVEPGGISLAKLLSPIGLGRIPLSIIWYAYSVGFGVSGLVGSYILAHLFPIAVWFLAATIPFGIVCGWHFTKHSVRFIAPFLRTSGLAEASSEMIGRMGRVTSLQADGEWGEAVFTVNGATNHVIVRTDDEVLNKDTEIIIVDYDKEKKRPVVGRLKA